MAVDPVREQAPVVGDWSQGAAARDRESDPVRAYRGNVSLNQKTQMVFLILYAFVLFCGYPLLNPV